MANLYTDPAFTNAASNTARSNRGWLVGSGQAVWPGPAEGDFYLNDTNTWGETAGLTVGVEYEFQFTVAATSGNVWVNWYKSDPWVSLSDGQSVGTTPVTISFRETWTSPQTFVGVWLAGPATITNPSIEPATTTPSPATFTTSTGPATATGATVTLRTGTLTAALQETFTHPDGSPWPTPWETLSGTGTVQNGRGRQTSPATAWTAAEHRAHTTIDDGAVTATMRFPATTNRAMRLNIRWDPATGNGYRVSFTPDWGGEQLMAVTGWAETVLDERFNLAWTADTDYRVRVETIGSTIRVRSWTGPTEPTTWDLEATDPTYTSGDLSLVTMCLDTAAAVTGEWDDVTVETASGEVPGPATFTTAAAQATAGGATATLNGGGTPGELTPVTNPERGWYHYTETHEYEAGGGRVPLTVAGLQAARALGRTVIFRYYVLDKYLTTDTIEQSFLDMVTADCAAARTAGVKLLARFCYSTQGGMTPPYHADPPAARVLGHIAQLAPRLDGDVTDAVQAGFIGMWGEWFYTDHFGDLGTTTPQQWADRKAVVDTLLQYLDPRIFVLVRYVGAMRQLIDAEPANQAYATRLGHHNDAFMTDTHDWGTYETFSVGYTAAQNRTWLAARGRDGNFPLVGETAGYLPPRSDLAASLAELETYSWTALNPSYHLDVLAAWGEAGRAVVGARLGYRLTLSPVTATVTGGGVDVSFTVTNDGWAAIYRPRPVLVDFVSGGTTVTRTLPVDVRNWTPGTTQVTGAVAAPPAGTWTVFLRVADESATLRDNPLHAVAFANPGVFDPATGRNTTGQTVTTTATSQPATLTGGTGGATATGGAASFIAAGSARLTTASGTAAATGGTVGFATAGAAAFTTTAGVATAGGNIARLRTPVIIQPATGADFGLRLACYDIDGPLRGRARGMLIERYARAGETGRLKVGFSRLAPRSDLFNAPVEIAVEYLAADGTTWVEPEDGRYVIAQDDHERTADPTGTHDLNMLGIAQRLNAAKVLTGPEADIQTDGKRQFLSKTPGQIIGTLLAEAKARGAFPTLTAGFTATHDSNGDPWDLVYNRAYELNHSLLGILQNLHDGGAVDYWIQGQPPPAGSTTSARILHMVPAGERGRELATGMDPVYLRDRYARASPERDDWTRLANHAVLIGDEGARWEKTNPEAYAPFGRVETVILAGGVSNEATAMLMIDRALAEGAQVARQLTREWAWAPDVRWMPDRDIRIGDWVLADTAAGTRQRVRVADLMTRQGPDGIEAFITLGTVHDDLQTRMAKRQIGIEGGAGVGSIGRPTPKPPPDPTNQYGERPGNFTVTVSAWPTAGGYGGVFGASWDAVTVDTDGYAYEPDEYVVHARKHGGPWMDMFRTSSLTGQAERSDMRPGEVWEAQVAARRGAQTGVWSPLWVGTIPEDTQAPPKPSKATGESPPGQLVVGWDGLADGGGTMPLDLKLVEVHLNGVTREEWKIGITGGSLRLDAGPDTFTIGDMIETRLVAVDWAGNRSEGSDPIWVGISEHAQWPGTPTGLVATASSFMTPEGFFRGMISAAWGEVTVDIDGDPIDIRGYGVRARRTAGQFATDWFDIAGTTSPTALSATGTDELMNVGDTWEVAVAATSTAGHTGPASEPVEVVIPPDDVPPPIPSRPTVTSSRSLLTVTWDGLAQGGGGMPPDLRYLTVHITGLADTWTLDRTTRMVHISGLSIGTAYEVRLSATDYADNTSDPSQPAAPVEVRSVMDDTDWQALMATATSYGDNLYPDANYAEPGRNTVREQYGWTLTEGEGRATPTNPVPGEARILWLTPSGSTDTGTALTPGDTYQLAWRIDTGAAATDITVVRGLDGQAPVPMHAPVAQSAGSDQAWNYTITAVAGNRYGIQVTGGATVYAIAFRKRVTTTMIDDGAIVADKIAANHAMAARFSGLLAEFDEAFVGVLTADMLSATALDFQSATGLTLTAPNIQSTDDPMRGLKLTPDYKRVYNTTGVMTMSENYATGDIELSGAIRNRASGYPRFELLPGDNPQPGWSGIQWVPGPGWNLLPALSTNAIRAGDDTPGGLYLRGANWHALTSIPEVALRSGRVINGADTFWPEIDLWIGGNNNVIGRFRLRDIGQGKTAILAHADFFNFNTPGGQQYIRMPVEGTLGDITIRTGNGGIINHVADGRFVVTGLHGTTGGATVTIETDGRMMRFTSLSEYKLDQQDVPAVWELLDVTPKTWIDRARREADPDYAGRFAGFVAEDVQTVSQANGGSLDPLLIHDDDGALQGVAYQAWTAYHHALIRELRDRIETLEGSARA